MQCSNAGDPDEPLLYLVFIIVVAALYVPCRWFAGVKARQQQSWLS